MTNAIFDAEIFEQKFKAAKERYMAECREIFDTVIKGIFDLDNRISKLYWTQYTPYFNDGDTCYFSVHELNFTVDGFDLDEDDDGTTWSFKYKFRDVNDDIIKKLELATNAFESISPIFMEDAFGDHLQISVTRDLSYKKREYDHE